MNIYEEIPVISKEKQDAHPINGEDTPSPIFKLQAEVCIPEAEPQIIPRHPPEDVAQAEFQPQLEFDGMAKPSFSITFEECLPGVNHVTFRNAPTLLESLEAQKVEIPYQCRDGYCGACRCKKITGEVSYLKEPMAWINDDEILPCVSIPITDLHLKFNG